MRYFVAVTIGGTYVSVAQSVDDKTVIITDLFNNECGGYKVIQRDVIGERISGEEWIGIVRKKIAVPIIRSSIFIPIDEAQGTTSDIMRSVLELSEYKCAHSAIIAIMISEINTLKIKTNPYAAVTVQDCTELLVRHIESL